MMWRFLLELFVIYIINMVLSFFFSAVIPNVVIAQIATSVALALIFAYVDQWVDRRHFYRYPRFWYTFFITGIFFVLTDMLFFLL